MKKYLKIFGITLVLLLLVIGSITGYLLINRYPLSSATGETKKLKKNFWHTINFMKEFILMMLI